MGAFADLQAVLVPVMYAILGAAGWEGLKWLLQNWRGRELRKRYALGGDYETSFDDQNPQTGGRRTITEVLSLTQEGRRVRGTSTVTGSQDDRAWSFEGYVGPEGRIACWYRSNKPDDLGLGTFFMERDHFVSSHYAGTWIGYAPAIHKVDQGTYTWRKRSPAAPSQRQHVGSR